MACMAYTREVPDKGRIGGDLFFLPLFQPARVKEYNGQRAKYRLDLYHSGIKKQSDKHHRASSMTTHFGN